MISEASRVGGTGCSTEGAVNGEALGKNRIRAARAIAGERFAEHRDRQQIALRPFDSRRRVLPALRPVIMLAVCYPNGGAGAIRFLRMPVRNC